MQKARSAINSIAISECYDLPTLALPRELLMTSALDVVTFGEAMMLLVADRPGALEDTGSFYKRTAGAETNVAIGLALGTLCLTPAMRGGLLRDEP